MSIPSKLRHAELGIQVACDIIQSLIKEWDNGAECVFCHAITYEKEDIIFSGPLNIACDHKGNCPLITAKAFLKNHRANNNI